MSQARHAQCIRTRMTRRSVSSRYSSGSRGANMLRRYRDQPLNTERTNVISASAASCSVCRMLLTIDAAPSGWVTRKNTNNAAPDRIRTFLTFTGCYSVSLGGLLNLFLKTVVPHELTEREAITALGARTRPARVLRLR